MLSRPPWIRRDAGRRRRSPWWPRELDRARARSIAGAGAAGGLCRADRGAGGTVPPVVAVVGNGLAVGGVARAVEAAPGSQSPAGAKDRGAGDRIRPLGHDGAGDPFGDIPMARLRPLGTVGAPEAAGPTVRMQSIERRLERRRPAIGESDGHGPDVIGRGSAVASRPKLESARWSSGRTLFRHVVVVSSHASESAGSFCRS